MEILRAIERADALCPNPYTLDEKLSWCDEVTAELRRNAIKIYSVIETEIDDYGELVLPDDVPFERIELVFVGNQRFDKHDFRSFVTRLTNSDVKMPEMKKFTVVYLTMPKPIRNPEIKGEFNTGTDTIEITDSPFIVGDRLKISVLKQLGDEPNFENAMSAHVMEIDDNKIMLDCEILEPQTKAPLAIRRVIEDTTEIDEAPYDGMYIEYILAKMALYQHDYTSYNAHMTVYNSLFDSLCREYAGRRPLTTQANFRNYSRI